MVSLATKKKADMKYAVTMHGEYITVMKGETDLQPYEETFVVSGRILALDDVVGFGGAIKAWDFEANNRRRMFDARFPKGHPQAGQLKYPGYQRLASHMVKEIRPLDGSELDNPMWMNNRQLYNYIKENNYPIEPVLYPNDGQLKAAVLEYEEALRTKTTQAFIERQNALMAKRSDSVNMIAELGDLNDEISEEELADILAGLDGNAPAAKSKGGRPRKEDVV